MKTYATVFLALVLISCSSKMTVQKAVFKNGKIVPVEKPVVFKFSENDTLMIVKKVR